MGEKLAEGLQESAAMVVLLTPNSLRSPNVSYELGYALGNKDYKGRLVSVITPAELPREEIPWVLKKFPMIHLRDDNGNEEGLKRLAEALQAAA